MDLVLIRHARPERIEDAEGPADPPLTEIGHRQARAVAGWLAAEPWDVLYSSPMVRARQTSAPLAALLGMEPILEAGVREFDAEESSYIPMEEMKADKEAYQAMLAEFEEKNYDAFGAEVVESLERIVAAEKGKKVAVVCHGGVINIWAAHVLGIESGMFFEPDYTSIHRFICSSRGHRSMVSLNETAHLRSHPDLLL